MLSRSADSWQCLSNVCTHRGHLLAGKPLKGHRIRCRYHGRTFDQNGCMTKAPGFDGASGFPSASDDLPRLPLREIGGLLFTRLSSRGDFFTDFEEFFQPVRKYLPWDYLNALRPYPKLDQDYPLDAHWALYCDNYLEGFHIPYVHPALNKILDIKSYETLCFDSGSLQIGIAKPGEKAFAGKDPVSGVDQQVAAYYFFFFPNLMLNFYPWGLSLNLVEPKGQDRCLIRFRTFIADDTDIQPAYDIDQVQQEDEAVVLSVQQGINSRLYHSGRFAPSQEKGVHHFHRQLARFL